MIIIAIKIINTLILPFLHLYSHSLWWLFDDGDSNEKDGVDVYDVNDDDYYHHRHHHHHDHIDGWGSVLWQGMIGSQLCNLIIRRCPLLLIIGDDDAYSDDDGEKDDDGDVDDDDDDDHNFATSLWAWGCRTAASLIIGDILRSYHYCIT